MRFSARSGLLTIRWGGAALEQLGHEPAKRDETDDDQLLGGDQDLQKAGKEADFRECFSGDETADAVGSNIVEFRVDQHSGALTPTGQVIETGSPSCIAFAA